MPKFSQKMRYCFLSVLVIVSVTMLMLGLFSKSPNSELPKFTVLKVEIFRGEQKAESFVSEVYASPVNFEVKINDGASLDGYKKPEITWSFEGNGLGLNVSKDGTVSGGDTLGETYLCVSVKSKNEVSAKIPVTLTKKAGSEISGMHVVSAEGQTQNYIEGQTLDKNKIVVWVEFGNYDAKVLDFEMSENPLEFGMDKAIAYYDDFSYDFPITVAAKTLQSIEVENAPTKTQYIEGQTFDKTGLTIKANYEYKSEIVSNFVVNETDPLEFGTKSVDIDFTFGGVTKTTTQSIDVAHRKLVSIEVDDTNAVKRYTQGDKFDKTGLIVTANFEVVESKVVENFTFSEAPLMGDDTSIEIFYSENGITKSAVVSDLVVEKPYSNIRRVNIACKDYISEVVWLYTYMNDEGKQITDNTAYVEHETLVCDKENGIYDIPVGAEVSFVVDGMVSELLFDGVKQNSRYPIGIFRFTLSDGDDVSISATILEANRITVRFAGDGKEKNFSLTSPWNKPLSETQANELALVFADSTNFFYTYKVDDGTYNFEELKTVAFSVDTLVEVTKVQRESQTKTLTIYIYDEIQNVINFEAGEISLKDLEIPSRPGFNFDGWALAENGEKLSEQDFATYLETQTSNYEIFALWTAQEIDYSAEAFVGKWTSSTTHEGTTVSLEITLKQDGTFEYVAKQNEVIISHYEGVFRYEENVLAVTDVSPVGEFKMLSPSDLGFDYSENKLNANLCVYEDDSLYKVEQQLVKTVD